MSGNIYIYIAVMAVVTYLVRALPNLLFRKKIKSGFLNGFFYYLPSAVLSAMTIPAVFYSTGSFLSALSGFIVAAFVSVKGKSLIVAAVCASLAAYAVNLLLTLN